MNFKISELYAIIIFCNYEFKVITNIEQIGEGGFAKVYKVELYGGVKYAVKVFQNCPTKEGNWNEFLMEARHIPIFCKSKGVTTIRAAHFGIDDSAKHENEIHQLHFHAGVGHDEGKAIEFSSQQDFQIFEDNCNNFVLN